MPSLNPVSRLLRELAIHPLATPRTAVRAALPLLAILCGLMALVNNPAAHAQLFPSADSFVDSASAGTNYGTWNTLVVDRQATTYLQFDLSAIPAGSVVQKATLVLFVDAVNCSGQIDAYSLQAPWVEKTLNYGNAPGLGASASQGNPASLNQSSVDNFVSLDITALAKAWIQGGAYNNGLALALVGPDGRFSFDSKENDLTSHQPQLLIVLAGSTGPQGPAGPQGPPGVIPANVALTDTPNTFNGSQTINGNLVLGPGGPGVQFGDGTFQATAATGAAVPSGYMIQGTSATPPPGYTYYNATTSGNTFAAMAPMPTPSTFLGSVAPNGLVYAIGGYSGATALKKTQIYNPVTHSWNYGADMPTARGCLAVVTLNGMIYAIGGELTLPNTNINILAGEPASTVEVYNPATDTWKAAANLPQATSCLSATVLNGKIYAIGGVVNGGISGSVFVYDPATGAWTTAAPMPVGRYLLGATSTAGKIYAIGGVGPDFGNGGELIYGTVFVYDPATGKWTTAAGLNVGHAAFVAKATAAGLIYVIGGFTAVVESYNPAQNAWTTLTSLPSPLEGSAEATVDNLLYSVGGSSVQPEQEGVMHFNLTPIAPASLQQFSPPVTLYNFVKN